MELIEGLPSRGQSRFLFPAATVKNGVGYLVEPGKRWQAIRARAGLDDVRLHDLRRTCASWLTAAGTSLAIVQKTLGHASIQTTMIYARLDLDPIREAAELNAARMIQASAALPAPAVESAK